MFNIENNLYQKNLETAMKKTEKQIYNYYTGQELVRIKDKEIIEYISSCLGVQVFSSVTKLKEVPSKVWRHACLPSAINVFEPSIVNMTTFEVYFFVCPMCLTLHWYRTDTE